jgi:serpin B
MCQTAAYRLVEDRGVQSIELPYGDGALSMVVLLPRPCTGLSALERALDGARLERRIAQIDETEPSPVEVHLPRFRVEASLRLNDVLTQLGAGRAVDPARADFSGMTDDSSGLCIGTVLHRALIEVNEEGTDAAPATAVQMVEKEARSVAAPPPIFRADHPFLFLIRDRRTRQVLFIGRLLDPTASFSS